MHILLFGANGQVGSDCSLAFSEKGYQLTSVTRQQVDFTFPQQIEDYMSTVEVDVVVNACAYTAVDLAEDETEIANKVNHLAVAVLAKMCADKKIPLIHLSTDYVFDGGSSEAYIETDITSPLGVYGQTKWLGEQAIEELCERHIILRTSWVFGQFGNNFVKTMLRLARERDSLAVVNDQYGKPTYVGHIVEVLLAFLFVYDNEKQLEWGTYHCSSEGETNWFEFALEVFERATSLGVLDKKPEVSGIPTDQYPTKAPRPKNSVLSTQKLENYLQLKLPSWREGLDQLLPSL